MALSVQVSQSIKEKVFESAARTRRQEGKTKASKQVADDCLPKDLETMVLVLNDGLSGNLDTVTKILKRGRGRFIGRMWTWRWRLRCT